MSKTKEFKELLGEMPTQVNPCGDCKMCCISPSIEAKELEASDLIKPKPACQKCPKLSDNGCSIYHDRPSICRGYLCLYALGYTDTRPDHDGVAWTLQPDLHLGGVLLVGHAMNVEDVFKSGRALRLMRKAQRSDMFTSAVVKDSSKVVRIDFDNLFPDMEVDVSQEDYMKTEILVHTQRKTKHSIYSNQ